MLTINSIRTRIISIIVGTCLFIIAVFVFYSYNVMSEYKYLKLKEITQEIRAEVEYVNKSISGIEYTVKNIASTASIIYADRHSLPPDKVRQYLSTALLDNQEMSDMSGGFGLWFEPYTFDENKKNFAVFAYKDIISDSKVVKWYSDNTDDYYSSDWYSQLLPRDALRNDIYSRKKVFWSMPITFTFGKEERFITNIGAYIYNEKGNIVGIATIGWQMSDFVRTLEHINISPNSKILLADVRYNKVITFTLDPSLKAGESLRKIPWFDQISNDLPRLGQVKISEININAEPHYVFTVMTDNNMLLASIVPESDLFDAIAQKAASAILLLAIFALIITVFTIYIVNRMLNSPIKKIIATAEQLAREFDPEFDLEEFDASDEISSLTSSFSKTIRHNYTTLKSILDGINYMIYIIDTRNFKLNYVNKHMQRYYTHIPKNALCYEAFLNRTEPCPFCPVVKMQEQGEKNTYQTESGDYFESRVLRLQAAIVEWNGSQNHALLSVTDITREVIEKERLEALAETDDLTGVLNRRGGLMALERVATLQRGTEVSIVMADLNGLKKVNDTFGHNEGDFYLNALTKAIQQNIRTNDLVSRLGGDEFLIILPNCSEKIAEKIFNKVSIDLDAILETEAKPYKGSFAFGIETFIADDNVNTNNMIEQADQKMYQHKNKYYNKNQ